MKNKEIWSAAELEEEYETNLLGQKLEKCEPRRSRLFAELLPCPSEEQELLIAIVNGDLFSVKRLIKEQPLSLIEPDRNGLYPIHAALLMGKIEIVDFLLDVQGSQVNFLIDCFGRRPVHLAAFCRAPRIVRRLVEELGGDVDDYSTFHPENQVIHVAARSGCLEIVRYLVDDIEEVNGRRKQSLVTSGGTAVIFSALILDSLPTFLFCLERNPEVVEQNMLDDFSYTVYWSAVSWGAIRILEWMKENSFERGLAAAKPITKIESLVAARYGCLELFKVMQQQGYRLEDDLRRKGDKNPITVAISFGNTEIVKFLVETYNPPLDDWTDLKGNSMLHKAVKCGCEEIVEYLASKMDLKRGSGRSFKNILILASSRCHIKTMEWILDSGICNVNEIDKTGSAALVHATRRGVDSLASVSLLISRGANIRARSDDPDLHATAFLSATANNDVATMEALWLADPECIWDVNYSDGKPFNALYVAIGDGSLEAAKFLVQVDSKKDLLEKQSEQVVIIWPEAGVASLQPSWKSITKTKIITDDGIALTKNMISQQTNPHLIHAFSLLVELDVDSLQCGLTMLEWLIDQGVDVNSSGYMAPVREGDGDGAIASDDEEGGHEEQPEEDAGEDRSEDDHVHDSESGEEDEESGGQDKSSEISHSQDHMVVDEGESQSSPSPSSPSKVRDLYQGFRWRRVSQHDLIFAAIVAGNLGAVKLLVEKAGVSTLHWQRSNARTPLHVAAYSSFEILKYLVQRARLELAEMDVDSTFHLPCVRRVGSSFELDVNAYSNNLVDVDLTVVGCAIAGAKLECLQYLISECGGVLTEAEYGCGANQEVEQVWHELAGNGDVEMWKYVESYLGKTFDVSTAQEPTPLCFALQRHRIKMVEFLIDIIKIPILPPKEEDQSWVSATIGPDTPVELMDSLLQRGVSLEGNRCEAEDAPCAALTIACLTENTQVVKWFHRMGFSLTHRDLNGWTPILAACASGSLMMVQWLLNHGVPSMDVNPFTGDTCLDIASNEDIRVFYHHLKLNLFQHN